MNARLVGGFCVLLAAALILGSFFASDTLAQESSESPPAAPIVNDEGGAVRISGKCQLHRAVLHNRRGATAGDT